MVEPHVDLSLHPPQPGSQTLLVCNKLIASTVEQLNTFAGTCEDKLLAMHHRMLRLETGVKLLESKLNSLPGSVSTPPATEGSGGGGNGGSVDANAAAALAAPATPLTPAAPAQALAPAAPEPVAPPPAPEAPGVKIKDDVRFAKYFKMVMVGVPKQVVKLKFEQETGFDPGLLDDPDAPAPPGGEDEDGASEED